MLDKATGRGADALILNLEDAVAFDRKELARNQVAAWLRTRGRGGVEAIVRVNDVLTDVGVRDLLELVPCGPDAILLPKVSRPETAEQAAWLIGRLTSLHDIKPGPVRLMAMIESSSGVIAAPDIARCHPLVAALVFGPADLAADLGCPPTPGAAALDFPRSQMLMAARSAGIDAFDGPHLMVADQDGLAEAATRARGAGFDGMTAIHPSQIGTINRVFSPTPAEVAWAEQVLTACGGDAPIGAALLAGSLVEAPHIRRAQRVLALAEAR